jgi:hypothetical protein
MDSNHVLSILKTLPLRHVFLLSYSLFLAAAKVRLFFIPPNFFESFFNFFLGGLNDLHFDFFYFSTFVSYCGAKVQSIFTSPNFFESFFNFLF